MKFIISLLLLTSCSYTPSPKFKVGDCIQATWEQESWESPWLIEKIISIGNRSYQVQWWSLSSKTWETSEFGPRFSSELKKVECPE